MRILQQERILSRLEYIRLKKSYIWREPIHNEPERQLFLPAMPRRIRMRERVIRDIAVAVESLPGNIVYRGVRTHEPTQDGVVFPGTHVDEPNLVVHLMAGETKGRLGGDRCREIGPIDLSALAPSIVRQALNDVAVLVGNRVHRPQVVGVQIPGIVYTRAALGVDHERAPGAHVVLVFNETAGGDALVEAADIDRR